MIKLTRWACVALLACTMAGCSQTVGPTAAQNRTGQVLSNSPLNKVTQIDDQGSITSEVAGPTDWIHQTPGDTVSHTTGMVTRTLTIEKPDFKVTLRSGSDIGASGVEFDPASGSVKVGSFSTSSSAPLVALGDLQAKTGDVMKTITAEQASVLKTISENQKATILGVAEKVSPEFLNALKALLGG